MQPTPRDLPSLSPSSVGKHTAPSGGKRQKNKSTRTTTDIASLMPTEPRQGKTPLKPPSGAFPFPQGTEHINRQTHQAWTGRSG